MRALLNFIFSQTQETNYIEKHVRLAFLSANVRYKRAPVTMAKY